MRGYITTGWHMSLESAPFGGGSEHHLTHGLIDPRDSDPKMAS